MKAVAILLLAVVAMAAAQGVNVVDNNNPGGVNFVDNVDPVRVVEQPEQGIQDPGFYRPSAGGNNGAVVDPGFYRPGAGNNDGGIIDDTAFYRPSANNPGPPTYPVITNPDPGFYLPSQAVPPSVDSGFVVDPGFYQPSNIVDSAFYQPSDLVDSAFYRSSKPQAPSIGPTFVQNDSGFYRPSAGGNQNRPYPPKQYPNAFARGGK